MRTARPIKTTETTRRHKVRKKRYKSRTSCNFGCTTGISCLDLENINEVLRVNRIHIRNHQADHKGSWKVVPKDSCEVYKERRRRQTENSRQDTDVEMQTDSDDTASSRKQKREDRRSRKGPAKKTRRRQRPKCRCADHSSMSSVTTTTTSCMSSSEMDNE